MSPLGQRDRRVPPPAAVPPDRIPHFYVAPQPGSAAAEAGDMRCVRCAQPSIDPIHLKPRAER